MIRSFARSSSTLLTHGRSARGCMALRPVLCSTPWPPVQQQQRWYTPMTKEEEEAEKSRVASLSPEEKDQELRDLNRRIAKLEMLRGINNGELYTWSGRYKALLRNYGMPMFVYYWVVWITTGVATYAAIDIGGLDAAEVIYRVDMATGFDLVSKVDPAMGKIGLALVMNEMLEPLRLPFVVATLKPMMDIVSPSRY